MNHGPDPHPPRWSWRQVVIRFDDYARAEHTAVAHLCPAMSDAESTGQIVSWFFTRKAPCWRLRLLPCPHSSQRDTTRFLHQHLTTLRDTGRIANWVETSYEPETHTFGGAAAMDLAHHLFHRDSRHILGYLASNHTTTPTGGRGERRRELSILLCTLLMRGAGQDCYEQADIWARVGQHRPLPPDIPPDRLRAMQPDLQRLMSVDTSPASTPVRQDGPLNHIRDWASAFEQTGRALGDLAGDGSLDRGARAVLAHHVIFHWNRIGLPYTTQAILANAATAAILRQ